MQEALYEMAKGPGASARPLAITLLYAVIIFCSKAVGHYAVAPPSTESVNQLWAANVMVICL